MEGTTSNEKMLKPVPICFLDYISDKGIDRNVILSCVRFDLNRSGFYDDGFLVITKEKFYVAEGKEEKTEEKTGEKNKWFEKSFAEYEVDEFESFKAENFITTGSLVAKLKDGSFFPFCFFTNTSRRAFGNAANLLEKLKKKEDLNLKELFEQEQEEFCPTCGKRYSDPDRKVCEKCMKKGKLFIRVLSYAPKYKGSITFIAFALLLVTGFGLLRPVLNSQFLYNHVLNPESSYYGRIWELVGLIIFYEIVTRIIGIVQNRRVAAIAANIIYDIKTDLFSKMQNLSMSFYNNKQTGSLMNRVNQDAIHIQYFLVDGLPYFVINAITIVSIAVIIFTYNPLLCLLVFIPAPAVVFIVKRMWPQFWKARWRRWNKSAKLNSVLNDSLSGVRVVKAFGKENSEVGRFSDTNMELFRAQLHEGLLGNRTFPIMSYIMSIGGLFVWIVGGYDVATGKNGFDFGTLIMLVSYVGMIYGPLDFMVAVFDWWSNCMTSASRIFEIMDTNPDVVESSNPTRISKIEGRITLKNVKFEYLPNKPVLHGINLDIEAGEMIGLVGHSGAGKSTITNLITRLYDVNEGSIFIDGIDIKNIKISDLRSQIGMVLQETVLFNGTVAENIGYAKPDATIDDIMIAAKLANAHDFIMKMRDGYETKVGTGKVRLSGGELQRISIARAILVNPRLLILDEATASVDTETESQIQEALERLVKGRTTIAIAHRLSTLRNADRLVVVDKGTIAESGTHEELELKKGKYYDMLQIQKKALKIGGISDESESEQNKQN